MPKDKDLLLIDDSVFYRKPLSEFVLSCKGCSFHVQPMGGCGNIGKLVCVLEDCSCILIKLKERNSA